MTSLDSKVVHFHIFPGGVVGSLNRTCSSFCTNSSYISRWRYTDSIHGAFCKLFEQDGVEFTLHSAYSRFSSFEVLSIMPGVLSTLFVCSAGMLVAPIRLQNC